MNAILRSGDAVGPPATAEWVLGPASTDGARLWTAGPSEARVAVREPVVSRAPSGGAPLFALTVTLERQPAFSETSLLPLVRAGVCALTVDAIPSIDELRLAGLGTATPLFARSVSYSMTRADGSIVMADAADHGSIGRAGLTTTLTADETASVIQALSGHDSGFRLRAVIVYRQLSAHVTRRLRLSLALVHEFLAQVAVDHRLSEASVRQAFKAATAAGAIQIEPALPDVGADDGLFPQILRAAASVLEREGDDITGPETGFRLATAPIGSTWLTLPISGGASTGPLSIDVSRPLHLALAALTRERPLDAFVTAVCPGPDGGFEPVARRLPSMRSAPPTAAPLAVWGSRAATLPLMLKTGRAPVNAHTLAASDLVLLASARPDRIWAVNDLVLPVFGHAAPDQHLPQIDGALPLWPDRVDATRFWYAPELFVVEPAATTTADSSPFLFSFHTVGHTSSGRPGVEATIRVRLAQRMSSATRQAWQARGEPVVAAVPLNGLSVSMELPFRDENAHSQVQTILASHVSATADGCDVTFELADQWARMAYGSMAIEGFQEQPLRLLIQYTFSAYVPVGSRDVEVAWGGKRVATAASPLFVSGDATRRPLAAALATTAVHATPVTHAALAVAVHHSTNAVLVGPAVVLPPTVYGIRTEGWSDRCDLRMPCNRFGTLYVQTSDGAAVASIGCQDAFALGQGALKLYEPLTIDLGEEPLPFRVYRSLQVPGRFLVLPRTYTIARFEPGDARGYRPALFLFSNIDAVDRDRTRCVMMATLQPAISPYWRQRLIDHLSATAHPAPQLQWPTDLPATPVYTWALVTSGPSAGVIEPAIVQTPEGFQVSLTADIDGILQLKAMLERGGISGAVSYVLGDGTSFATTLAIDLARIDGPFVAGAVETRVDRDVATLTNRLEQPLDVVEILPAPLSTAVPVEKRLAPSASIEVPLPAGTVSAAVRYRSVGTAAALDEVRTFVEDIFVPVVFQTSVDFAAAELTGLGVEARIAGVDGNVRARLTAAAPRAEFTLTLPLTRYLSQPTMQFAITRSHVAAADTVGPFHDWRLDTLGSVIELTPSFFQQE